MLTYPTYFTCRVSEVLVKLTFADTVGGSVLWYPCSCQYHSRCAGLLLPGHGHPAGHGQSYLVIGACVGLYHNCQGKDGSVDEGAYGHDDHDGGL